MKHLVLIFLFIPSVALGQFSFNGVEIDSFSPPEDWGKTTLESGQDVWYKEDGVGYFDFAIFSYKDEIPYFTFNRKRGTYLVLKRTYDKFYSMFGKEDVNNDYIPEYAEGSNQMLSTAVSIGEAEIYRGWIEEDYRIVLSWKESGLMVDIAQNK